MVAIFAKYLPKFMAMFVDDFMINLSRADHVKCLRLMLKKCREKQVCLITCKNLFGASRGALLGHVVSWRAIEMAADKVRAISKARTPTNVN